MLALVAFSEGGPDHAASFNFVGSSESSVAAVSSALLRGLTAYSILVSWIPSRGEGQLSLPKLALCRRSGRPLTGGAMSSVGEPLSLPRMLDV